LSIGARRRGWRCETAHRARQVLDKINHRCEGGQKCYDAIVTDVNFMDKATGELYDGPRVTGVHVVKQIREKYPNVPVVYYTGYDTQLVRQQARAAGGEASDYVVKSKPEVGEFHLGEIDRVLGRVSRLLDWMSKRKLWTGPERRKATGELPPLEGRREGDDQKVSISPALERILSNTRRLLRGESSP
jgi:CheY-like chemotaxis protein